MSHSYRRLPRPVTYAKISLDSSECPLGGFSPVSVRIVAFSSNFYTDYWCRWIYRNELADATLGSTITQVGYAKHLLSECGFLILGIHFRISKQRFLGIFALWRTHAIVKKSLKLYAHESQ